MLQLETVQTYLAKRTAAYLSDELNTTISVDRVKLRLLKYVDLEGLMVEDQEGDTLALIGSLSADLYSLSLEEEEVSISVALDKPYVNLIKHKGDTIFNYQFLVDYFKSDEESSDTKFTFRSDQLKVSNGRFSLHDQNKADTSDRADYYHLDLNKINLLANEVIIKGIYIDAQLKNLSFITDDDFELNSFSADLKIEPEVLSFQSLKIQTFRTELFADLILTAHSFKSYKNFIEEVFISADFKNALVELADIAYFVPQMTENSNQVLLNGKVAGTVGNLSSKSFELHLNKNTYLLGEFDFRGLPDINETFIFFEAEEFHTNAEGLRNLPISSFKEGVSVNIPKEVDRLGDVDFTGNFTGFISDFVAYGKFKSGLGPFGSDISLTQADGRTSYKGSLSANKFDLGSLLANEDLGRISFNLELDGSGLTLDEINAAAVGKVSAVNYKKYRYDNIDLNGEFSSKRFEGKLKVQDQNLKMDFEGRINADTSVLVSDFHLRVDKAKLASLNLFNQTDSLTNLTFQANFNLLGSKLEELDGKVYFDSLRYVDKDMNYKTDSVYLKAEVIESGRQVFFSSSFLEANLKGQFKLVQLADLIKQDIIKQVPNESLKIGRVERQDFEYEILVKEFDPICQIFIPKLKVDS